MICNECGKKNYLSANYCYYCDYKFSEAEKNVAYGHSIYAKLDKIEEIKSKLDGSVVTGNKWFRLIVLILILVVGLLFKYKTNDILCISNLEDSSIVYELDTDRYIVYSNDDAVNIDLLVPMFTKSYNVETISKETGEVVSTNTYRKDEALFFDNIETNYYRVSVGNRSIDIEIVREDEDE